MATEDLGAIFFKEGVPKTGLSPTIDVWNVTDSVQEVSGAAMTELGGGLYTYTLAAYDSSKEYAWICDGTSTLLNHERYAYGSSLVVET